MKRVDKEANEDDTPPRLGRESLKEVLFRVPGVGRTSRPVSAQMCTNKTEKCILGGNE